MFFLEEKSELWEKISNYLYLIFLLSLVQTSFHTFLIIINVENSCAAQYFHGFRDAFYFSWFTDEQKVQKNSIY